MAEFFGNQFSLLITQPNCTLGNTAHFTPANFTPPLALLPKRLFDSASTETVAKYLFM